MLKIVNGEVYDPVQEINGAKVDIWIEKGKVVSVGNPPSDHAKANETIDASGSIVMAGGVDIHSHIAGSKVNMGRKMRPEDHRKDPVPGTDTTRSGCGLTVPTTFVIGYRYAQLGYTTVMEAAAPPLGARHVHEELNDIPILDKGFYTLLGNNHLALKYIEAGNYELLKNHVAWVLGATKGYGIKIVNAGGNDSWKWGKGVNGINKNILNFEICPRDIITNLARVHQDLGLPHSIHLHCNNLGMPGNYAITLETLKALEGFPVHVTHAQFNSFGGRGWTDFNSKAGEVAEYINSHENVTFDAGQIVFGDVTTMTADGPWQQRLHHLSGNKWSNNDVEAESGSGIVPYKFKQKSLVNGIQWAIGLELMLMADDPWRAFLTTDHPNAGPFTRYPQIIKLLMQKDYRDEILSGCSKKVKKRTSLDSLKREYSLYEIAIITRAGTARALGMKNKGHLSIGADADVSIYPKHSDPEVMFSNPKWVLKGGEVIVKDGKLVKSIDGKTIYTTPYSNPDFEGTLKEEFERIYSVSWNNYPVQDEYVRNGEAVPCR